MAGEMHDQSNRVQASKAVAHVAVEVGEAELLRKQIAVDVGERGQRLVEILLPLLRRRVEHVEQPRQVRPKVGAVRLRAVLDVQPECLALEDARVFGEKAEQNAHQKAFQLMALVAAGLQGVVKIVHDLYGAEVDRVLVLEPVLLVARDERKMVDVLVQLGERKLDALDAEPSNNGSLLLLFRLQIVERDPGKVGNDDVAGNVVLPALADEVLDVAEGLRLGFAQVFAEALVLDQQHAGPEKVDVAVIAGDFLYRLLERGHRAAADAEDLEKLVPKRLFLGSRCSRPPNRGQSRWRFDGFRSRKSAWRTWGQSTFSQ